MQMRGFRKQSWISWKLLISWLLTLDLDNFRFIVHISGFCYREWNFINIDTGFREFRFLDPP